MYVLYLRTLTRPRPHLFYCRWIYFCCLCKNCIRPKQPTEVNRKKKRLCCLFAVFKCRRLLWTVKSVFTFIHRNAPMAWRSKGGLYIVPISYDDWFATNNESKSHILCSLILCRKSHRTKCNVGNGFIIIARHHNWTHNAINTYHRSKKITTKK